MSLTTVTVSIAASLFLGTPLPRGTVRFELTGADRDGAIVAPQSALVTLDDNGQGSIALWPNVRGTQGTQYRVIVRNAAGELQQSALATVPASNCNLHEILQLAAPPVVDDAQAAALDAQTHAAEASTSAGAAQASRIAADADAVATEADRVQTGLDRAATGADRTLTGLDRTQTSQDKAATAADRVQTGLDRVATGADRSQTGQDKAATAADRVQTGQDRTAASGSATSAQDWATKTAGGQVAATDYSAKEFAQGTQTGTGGSAKSWAQQTGADVTGAAANSRSARSWAQDVLIGATLGGSAKDWAQSASLPDGTSKSAKSYAADASTAAVAAAVANALGQAVDKTGAAETSTSTGAGDMTLAGALTGFQAISALCVDYEWVEYRIRALDGAGLLTSTQEHGWGLYRTGGTLVRVLVLDSSASGSGRVSFAAGTKVVSLVRRMRDMPTVQEVLRAGLDSTAVTATTLITWRPRRALTLSDLQASLAIASSSGPVTLDIRVNGVSLLTTLLSIAQGSKTSVGGTAAVFADPDLAPDDEVTIVCTAAGTGAAGLCITLVGNETPVTFMDGLSLRLTPEDMRPFHTRASTAWALVPTTVTNYARATNDPTNAVWTKVGTAPTLGALTGPDGSLSMCKLTEDTSTGNHLAGTVTTVWSIGQVVTASVWFSATASRRFMSLRLQGPNGGIRAAFDSVALTVATSTVFGTGFSNISATVTPDAFGTYRVTLTARVTEPGTGSVYVMPHIGAPAMGSDSYTGDGTSFLYFYGLQVEAAVSVGPYLVNATAAPLSGTVSVLTSYGAGVLRTLPSPAGVQAALREPQSTNGIRNNSMVGAAVGVIGSGGALPTNWGHTALAGLTCEVRAVGTENGAPYIDLRYSGTSTGTSVAIRPDAAAVAGITGESWSATFYARLLSTNGNFSGVRSSIVENTAGGAFLTQAASAQLTAANIAALSMVSYSRALSDPSCAQVYSTVILDVVNGVAVDFTVRLALQQLEKQAYPTSPILTSGAAVTRVRDELSLPMTSVAGQPLTAVIDFVLPGHVSAGAARLVGGAGLGVSLGEVAVSGNNFYSNASGTALGTANAVALGGRSKAATAADGSGRSQCLNGGAVATDATSFAAITSSVLLGQTALGGDSFSAEAFIHEVRICRKRMANNKLRRLTA